MVEEECRRYKPTKNYLEHLGTCETTAFETELLKNELERIQNRIPMEGLAMKRYELPPPPPGKLSEVGAWNESVKNSMAQLEHQSVRAINLELMMEYGCEAWKSNLEVLTSLQAKAQTQLQDLRKEIQEVNWQRKSKQMQAGDKLRALEAQWVLLVSKNYEIEQACARIEEDIYILKASQPENGQKEETGNRSPVKEDGAEEEESTETEEPEKMDQDDEQTNEDSKSPPRVAMEETTNESSSSPAQQPQPTGESEDESSSGSENSSD